MGSQRMPVGHEEKTRVLGLQPNPVFQCAVVVTKMHCAGRTHARDNTIRIHGDFR